MATDPDEETANDTATAIDDETSTATTDA